MFFGRKMNLFIALTLGVLAAASHATCSSLSTCVSCTEGGCGWLTASSSCQDKNAAGLLTFDDQCPTLDVQSGDETKDKFLENWMGQVFPLNPKLTLLDLSLPGTHDTLSYDLSLRVSDGGIDNLQKLAALLHVSTSVIPDSLEDYMREQGQTQGLTVTQQLDAGNRFLDLRLMYEYQDKRKDAPPGSKWYSLHVMESNQIFLSYLTEIRAWVDNHPTELVVLWISKHGDCCATGQEQYPKTPIEEKQAFWQQIEAVFKGLLFNAGVSDLASSPLQDLVRRGERVVIYAADWAEFTAQSSYALDSCKITNLLGPGVSNETAALEWETGLFSSMGLKGELRTTAKAEKRFVLMSLATGVPSAQMTLAALIKFLPGSNKESNAKCCAAFNIPGYSHCPETLLDIAQLENYYKQLSLEEVVQQTVGSPSKPSSWGFPNAIYINAVDFDGTIRTGTQVLWGKERSPDTTQSSTAYAYVDSIVAFNVHVACDGRTDGACGELARVLADRRAKHPLQLWQDEAIGRKTNWPV